eukprot:3898879-Amphidinium_carterae.1
MFQDRSYVATQYLLNDEEMKDLREYKLTKEYQQYPTYLETGTHLVQKKENTSTSSQKPSITTADSEQSSTVHLDKDHEGRSVSNGSTMQPEQLQRI